jgi:RNA recognition motif-containing protein
MKIFVTNLGYRVTNESLRATFATYGEVSSSEVILDTQSGRSKGMAVIQMPNISEAEKAILRMDGSVLDGKAIEVKNTCS